MRSRNSRASELHIGRVWRSHSWLRSYDYNPRFMHNRPRPEFFGKEFSPIFVPTGFFTERTPKAAVPQAVQIESGFTVCGKTRSDRGSEL